MLARVCFVLLAILSFDAAHADGDGGFFLAPSVGVGTDVVQGTYFRLGLDLGYRFENDIYGGIGAYYASGSHSEADREIGGGPFIGYFYPVARFLVLHFREDVDYVDEHNPLLNSDGSYSYTTDYGLESFSYAGIQINFTRAFGISVGYRLAVGLTKSSLADGRSGAVFGLLIGF